MIKAKLFALALTSLTLSTAASAFTQTVHVSKDTHVDTFLCCVQDSNFGAQEVVSVGQFNHYRTQAWLGFDFSNINAFSKRTSSVLVLPAVTLGDNATEVKVSVGLATQDWQELDLTFNNKPEFTNIAQVTIKTNEPTSVDISDSLYESFAAGDKNLTIVLQTEGGGHFFLPSKESATSDRERPTIVLNEIIHF